MALIVKPARRVGGAFLVAALLPTLQAPTLCAQDESGRRVQADQRRLLEEVLVTARRRGEERLQDVPIAVSVLSSDDLRVAHITSVAEVASRTPSFSFGEQIGNQQELVIRGIGTLRLIGSAAEPSVGLFIDEVYVGRRGAATPPLFDLERIEVARGPQGTLYGKNVVGGAVSLFSAPPTTTFAGRASIAYGQFDALGGRSSWESNGYLSGALTETVAGRVAVHYRKHEGYSQNTRLNEALDDLDSYAARGSVLFQPNDSFDLRVAADFSHDTSNGQSRRAVDDPTLPGLGAVVGSGLLDPDVRRSDSPWKQWEERDTAGLTARADYRLAGGSTITYLTGVRYGDFAGRYSQVGTTSRPALTDAASGQHEKYVGITQDLRMTAAADSNLQWVTGLYFLQEDTELTDHSIATSYLAAAGAGGVGDVLDGEYIYDQRNVSRSTALYGEASWALPADVALTLGARYTNDRKKYRNRSECLDYGAREDFIFCMAPLRQEFWDIHTKKHWAELTPTVGIDWRPTRSAMIYAKAARGFKGGGWQGKPAARSAALQPYDPESAWTYEAGMKGAWDNGQVTANVALFRTSFSDLQVEQLDDAGLTLIIDNAATARIHGIELELHYAPLESLLLWLNGTYTDSEYTRFVDSAGRNLSGNRMARTPEFKIAGGIGYGVPLGGQYMLDARMEYRWQDDMIWLAGSAVTEEDFGLLDVRLALSAQGAWEVALYAKNATDRLYRVDVTPFLGDVFSRYAPPRSYGLQVSRSFGR